MNRAKEVSGIRVWGAVDDPEVLQRYRDVARLSDCGLYQLDAAGRFLAVNDSLLEQSGYASDALLGEHISVLLDDNDVDRIEHATRERLDGEMTTSGSFDVMIETADEEHLPVELRINPLVGDGDLQGSIGAVHDRGTADREPEQLTSAEGAYDSIRTVLDEANIGVFVLDAEFNVAWIDETIETIFGLDRESVIGQDKRQLIEESVKHRVADPDHFAETVLATYDDNSYIERFECRLSADENRDERWLEHYSKPIESGEFEGGRIELYYDITGRKQSEDTLQEAEQRFRSLVDAVEEYAIFRLDEDGYVTSWNAGAEAIKGYEREEILGEHFSTFYTGEDRAESIPEQNLEAAIEAGSVEDEGWRLRKDGSRFWANVTITAVHGDDGTHEGFLKVTRDMTDRHRREQELESELPRILGRITDGFYALDEDCQFTHVNERAEQILGVDGEELLGTSLWTSFPELRDTAFDEYYHEAMRTQESVAFEAYYPSNDAWYEVHAYPSETGLSVYFRDVTEQKQIEAELEEVYGRISDAFFALDENWEFTHINERAHELINPDGRELVGKHVWNEFPDAIGRTFKPKYERAMYDQETVSFEEYYPEPLDAWFEVNAYPSETGLSVYFRDVTDRKEREAEFRMVAENVEEIIWISDPETMEYQYISPAFDDIWGVSRQRLYDDPGSYVQWIHPDDRERVRTNFNNLPDEPLDETFRIVRPDEETRWLRVQGKRVENEEGIARVIGIGQDITDRKERERKLEQTLDLLEKTERVADVAGWEVDPEAKKPYWSDHLFELLDIDHDGQPTLEQALDVYYSEEDRAIVEDALEEALETGTSFDVTARFPRPAGDVGWLRVQGEPQVEDGEVVSLRGAVQDVTEQRNREQHLRQYETIVEAVNDGIYVIGEDGTFTMINETYAEMLDYERDELIGADASIVVEDAVREETKELHMAAAEGRIEQPSMEAEIQTKHGEWLPVEATFALLSADEDDWYRVGVVRDISERKERERKLTESEQRYRTLVENFPEGAVGLINEDLEYTAIGGQLLTDIGIDPEERLGHSISELYPDDLIEEIEPYFQAALRGETSSFQLEFHDRYLHAHTLPIRNADGRIFAGMLVVQDVTKRREYQRQLEESNERLEQFAYAASHDLQEPLRMVSSYLQLLDRRYNDELDQDGQEFLEFAVDGAERMSEMIEGLLTYSRVETGGDPFEPVNLETVLDDVRDDLKVLIEESDAEITADELPTVHGDVSQLRQVFLNLLDNAIEYSGDDPPQISITADRDGSEWLISVRDKGIGIDPDDTDQVFEVFQRLHTQEEHAGTGIGLALCERIVERHGGEIWVESDSGEGTTFSFTLPVVRGNETGGQ